MGARAGNRRHPAPVLFPGNSPPVRLLVVSPLLSRTACPYKTVPPHRDQQNPSPSSPSPFPKLSRAEGRRSGSHRNPDRGAGESSLALILPYIRSVVMSCTSAHGRRLRAFSVVLLLLVSFGSPAVCFRRRDDGGVDRGDRFSILNLESLWHDYSPPSPPPSPPDPPSASCEGDFGGTGDFDGLCEVHTSVQLSEDLFVKANGSFAVYPDVVLSCPLAGCSLVINLTGEIRIGRNAKIVAGMVRLGAGNMSLADGAAINTTALAGDPPPQTSGVPSGVNGDGGGHGGRGASCVVKEGQTQEDSWGGDAYSWSTLTMPGSYGSKGGSTSREKDYGGGGGGQIFFIVKDFLEVNGSILADGGEGGSLGGGGSGGSIYINATKM